MDILKIIIVYVAGYFTILVGDYFWLGKVMKDFTIREFGNLISVTNGSIDIKLPVGLLAWAVITLLVYVFVIHSGLAKSYSSALMYGAIM